MLYGGTSALVECALYTKHVNGMPLPDVSVLGKPELVFCVGRIKCKYMSDAESGVAELSVSVWHCIYSYTDCTVAFSAGSAQ